MPPASETVPFVSVRSVTPLGGDLYEIAIRSSTGALRRLIVSRSLATVGNVAMAAQAVNTLVAIGQA